MNNIIAVLGFGRSGTTWLSDIISKVTGGLLLFEPFHPSVTELSKKFAYSDTFDATDSKILEKYFYDVLNKKHRKKWLMRNHVPFPLDMISEKFLDNLWRECRIIGFKSIRANFMVDWIQKHLNAKIVYVIRHPCAVISSIVRRKNFWEFGWPNTYEIFLAKTVYNGNYYRDHKISQFIDVVESIEGNIAKYAVMWCITHVISLAKLEKLRIPLFYYEDFYRDPFTSARNMFNYLGYRSVNIHPSYIFTPSMTTMRTVHGLYDKDGDIINKGANAFWENELSERDVDLIMDIVKSFGIYLYNKSGFPIRYLEGEDSLHY